MLKKGDTVTITVNGKDYTTTVGKDGSWTVDVDGAAIWLKTVITHDVTASCNNRVTVQVTVQAAINDKGYDIDTNINAQALPLIRFLKMIWLHR